MGLISLVYVSHATHPMTDDDLKQILETAQENNKKLDVSGMLLYREGFFIQALEGETSVVVALYDKIRQDPRHVTVTAIDTHPITERSFTGWSIGFNKLSDSVPQGMDKASYTDVLSNLTSEFFTEQPDRATMLLQSFRRQIYF